jgi:4-diphosphocytidyl-2-C-methyl-D-erythritol kinase
MFTLRAPAKINWFLSVSGTRKDGFHEIRSLMQSVTLFDLLTFENSDTLEVITEKPIPFNDNLVYKAMVLLKEACGVRAGARVTLRKEIPMAAGLGGGSSDAASALSGLSRLWKLNLDSKELARLGERLGSDVPFFLHGPASFVEGRGEIVTPVGLRRSCTVLLAKPSLDVSSGWAYRELDAAVASRGVLTKDDNNIKLFCQSLERGDFALLSSIRRNDLEAPVAGRYPVIGRIREEMVKMGALFSSMSGSGPTVFGVFDSEKKAEEAAARMPPHWCRVVRTVTSDT